MIKRNNGLEAFQIGEVWCLWSGFVLVFSPSAVSNGLHWSLVVACRPGWSVPASGGGAA